MQKLLKTDYWHCNYYSLLTPNKNTPNRVRGVSLPPHNTTACGSALGGAPTSQPFLRQNIDSIIINLSSISRPISVKCEKENLDKTGLRLTVVRNTFNKLLIGWDAVLLNLDDILYYFTTLLPPLLLLAYLPQMSFRSHQMSIFGLL